MIIMYRKITLFLGFWVVFYYVGLAQNEQKKTLTLTDCIDIALKNNFDLKSSVLKAKSSEINYNQSRSSILPNLNLDYNIGVNNGRSIDPSTNGYINKELTFSNAGLTLNTTVFNGFKILNSIKQKRYNMLASEMAIEENKQNLILEVTLRYIQILNNLDALKLAKSRFNSTEKQLKRLKILYKEGSGNPADYTDMQGQCSIDQVGIINAETNYKSAVLELVKLLNIDSDSEITFNSILGNIDSQKYKYSADEVYNDALQNLATFKSKVFKVDAATTGIKAAKADYFPEVSLFGQLNTNYSSVAQAFTKTGTITSATGDFVTINNQDYPVLRAETQFQGNNINYHDQFKNNLNSVVGVSVRIPLFNGFKTRNNVAIQKIQLKESLNELNNTKLIFKQAIKQAYNDMEAAYNSYFIQLNQVAAFEESYRINEVRFVNGESNIVNYITSKNNLDAARLNLNTTKYDYLLRVKILDYYRGI